MLCSYLVFSHLTVVLPHSFPVLVHFCSVVLVWSEQRLLDFPHCANTKMFVSVVKYTRPFAFALLCLGLCWFSLCWSVFVSSLGKAICVFIQGQTAHIVSCHTLCVFSMLHNSSTDWLNSCHTHYSPVMFFMRCRYFKLNVIFDRKSGFWKIRWLNELLYTVVASRCWTFSPLNNIYSPNVPTCMINIPAVGKRWFHGSLVQKWYLSTFLQPSHDSVCLRHP